MYFKRSKLFLPWSLYITFLIVTRVRNEDNFGRLLSCYSEKLKYEEFEVKFLFWSRNKQNQVYDPEATFGPEGIDFDPRRRTAVLVHGFMAHTHTDIMSDLAEQLTIWKDMNVINVNWEDGCSDLFLYQTAAVNSEYAAIKIERLFTSFIEMWNNTEKSVEHWGKIHLIGYSLGVHVTGQAAELLKSKHNLIIDRITALDAAAPCFGDVDSPLRINKNNARFVDVVHTDDAVNEGEAEKFGLHEPIGHVDFYVNGGGEQPGCQYRLTRGLKYFRLLEHIFTGGSCNHLRSLRLFLESVRNARSTSCKFYARPWSLDSSSVETRQMLDSDCKSCGEMGINAENYNFTSNVYYVSTTDTSPFCHI